MLIYKEDLKCVREMTIGELLDTLAQDDYDNYDYLKRLKLKQALCPILIQGGNFYAKKRCLSRRTGHRRHNCWPDEKVHLMRDPDPVPV